MTELELLERERELDERELDLDARDLELGVRERALDRHAHTIDAIGMRVRERARELAHREFKLEERRRDRLLGRWEPREASRSTSDATAPRDRRGGMHVTLVFEDEAVARLRADRRPSGGGGAPVAGAVDGRGGGTAAGGSLSGRTDPGSSDRQGDDAPATAMGGRDADSASDRCRGLDPRRRRRRFVVLGPGAAQIDLWRRRNGLAPTDILAVSTTCSPFGLEFGDPGEREVVLLEGWRLGAYAERLTWELAHMRAFHVAPRAARDAIAQVGLLSAGPRPRAERYGVHQQPAGVYCWQTYARALSWCVDFESLYLGASAGKCDVYIVDLTGLAVFADPDRDLADQGAIYTPADVAPARVSHIPTFAEARHAA